MEKGMYVVLIVAVVAVVSLVILTTNTGKVSVQTLSDADLAGMANAGQVVKFVNFPSQAEVKQSILSNYEIVDSIKFNRKYLQNGDFILLFSPSINSMSAPDLFGELNDLQDQFSGLGFNSLECKVLDTPPPYGSMVCS